MTDPTPTPTPTCEVVVDFEKSGWCQAEPIRCGKPAPLRDHGIWYCLECAASKLRVGGILSAEGTQTLLELLKAAGQEAITRASKATEGPWKHWQEDGVRWDDPRSCGFDSREHHRGPPYYATGPRVATDEQANADGRFIAAARTSEPLLGAAVLALVAEVERLRAASALPPELDPMVIPTPAEVEASPEHRRSVREAMVDVVARMRRGERNILVKQGVWENVAALLRERGWDVQRGVVRDVMLLQPHNQESQ